MCLCQSFDGVKELFSGRHRSDFNRQDMQARTELPSTTQNIDCVGLVSDLTEQTTQNIASKMLTDDKTCG